MAQIGDMANLEAQLTKLGSQVEHLAQILQRGSELSSEESIIDDWQDDLNDFTADIQQARAQLSSCSQQWTDVTLKEELLEQKEAEIKKREEFLELRAADMMKRQELLEQKAAEMMKREELLKQETADMTKRGELLEQRTRAMDEREEMIRSTEDTYKHACESLERCQEDFRHLMSRSGISSPAMNSAPAMRQDTTVNPRPDTLVPLGQGGSSATDPSGLSIASEHVRDIWRQIEFAADWTEADSAKLLSHFIESHRRKGGKNNRNWPQACMERGAKSTEPFCLVKDMKRQSGKARQDGRRCESHTPDQLCIDIFYLTDSPEEYDSAATDKRWRLEQRQ